MPASLPSRNRGISRVCPARGRHDSLIPDAAAVGIFEDVLQVRASQSLCQAVYYATFFVAILTANCLFC